MRSARVLDAMAMAVGQRRPKDVIHHSDQGSQGGFKRSSQRLDKGRCDEHSKTPIGSIWTGAITVTRSAANGGTR